MRLQQFSGTATRNLGACLFALATVLSGCASQQLVEPPSATLRQRMDRVVLRVFSKAEPGTYAVDELLVGAEEGAGYAAKNVAKAGAQTGLTIAAVSCHPGWGILWLLTCPYGAAAGAVVGVGTAVVGGAGGAIYGATQGRPQEEIDTAVATLDKSLLEIKLAAAFRDPVMSAIHKHTAAKIIDEEPRDAAMRQ